MFQDLNSALASHSLASSKQVCVIVDAYSSGNLLAPELRSRGFECLHVRSGAASLWKGFQANDFVDDLTFSGDFELLLAELRGNAGKEREIVCVLPGAECGVLLADQLSSALHLPSNGTRLSHARRNKFEMQVALQQCGIRSIPQIVSSSFKEILDWTRGRDVQRFVLKPVDSAGSDGVSLCSNTDELRQAFEDVYGKQNQLDLINSSVIVQEFVEGVEYAVDTVSCRGRHFVCDIWRYGKSWLNGAPVYDF
ncbi:MAG TPA: ATP-grasp domain-containing protein, partial [Terrimicrobiaceae bacterium]